MKKIYILAFIIFALLKTTRAQDNRREEIESFRIAFFTRQLNLTPDEAKKFWPVYNEMQAEMQKIHKDRRMRHRDERDNFDNLSDAEIEKTINDEMASRQKELDIEKKYHDRFKAVLPMKKIAIYYRAQEGFKRELLRKLQGQRRPPELD
jgi:hypothetical protein